MKRLALLLVFCVPWLGCHKISHGTIVEKQWHPAYTMFMPMSISCGQNCYTMVMIPIFYPDSYSVEVKGIDTEGKEQIETFWISREDYDRFAIGSTFTCGDAGQKQCETERPKKQGD